MYALSNNFEEKSVTGFEKMSKAAMTKERMVGYMIIIKNRITIKKTLNKIKTVRKLLTV